MRKTEIITLAGYSIKFVSWLEPTAYYRKYRSVILHVGESVSQFIMDYMVHTEQITNHLL